MTRHVALLRAVNVGGRGKVAMPSLVKTAERLGFHDIGTVLQTGNLLFSAEGAPAALQSELAAALAADLGLETEVMVRTAERWRALIAANPFAALAESDPAHLVLLVLKGKAAAGAEAALTAAITGREQVAVKEDAAFVAYPDGIGRSKLTSAVLDRHLRTPGTGRNWNTVVKIAARLGA